MRKIISIVTAAVMVILPMFCTASVSAYEQPYGIRLSIENKEININDIPDNREVSVAVYLDNAPSFIMISFIVKKDSRINYQSMNHVTKNPDVPDIATCNIGLGTGETPDIVTAQVFARPDQKISYSGGIAYVNLVLPENVSAGDFYSVELVPHNLDNYRDNITILTENDFDAYFGTESFSEFNSGGIYITRDDPPEPEPQQPPEQNNGGDDNNDKNDDEESKETTSVITTATTSAAAETSTASGKTTSLTETETEITTTETENETTTETVTTTTAAEKPKKKNGIMWLMIAAAAAAAAGVTGAVLIVKKKSE